MLPRLFKYALLLVLLAFLLTLTGFLIRSFLGVDLLLKDIAILSFLFSVISLISLAVFLRGISREPDSQVMHTLVSLSLKFLLDMILALAWFIIGKKTYTASVFIFFVIYLTITLFTIFSILKLLRFRSLFN